MGVAGWVVVGWWVTDFCPESADVPAHAVLATAFVSPPVEDWLLVEPPVVEPPVAEPVSTARLPVEPAAVVVECDGWLAVDCWVDGDDEAANGEVDNAAPAAEVTVPNTLDPADTMLDRPDPADEVVDLPDPADTMLDRPDPSDAGLEVPDPADEVVDLPDLSDEVFDRSEEPDVTGEVVVDEDAGASGVVEAAAAGAVPSSTGTLITWPRSTNLVGDPLALELASDDDAAGAVGCSAAGVALAVCVVAVLAAGMCSVGLCATEAPSAGIVIAGTVSPGSLTSGTLMVGTSTAGAFAAGSVAAGRRPGARGVR